MRLFVRAWVLLCVGLVAQGAMADGVIGLQDRLELFVDGRLVDRMENASLKLHEPRPGNTALVFDRPWEGRYSAYVTVFQDDDRYRMYYRGHPVAKADGAKTEVTCYAESRDGVTFEKPALGLFEVHGTRENNVVLAGMAPFSHNFAPFVDTRPGTPAAEKYKAMAGTKESGLYVFVSADGLHWEKYLEEPVLRDGAFDSQNVAFWSQAEQCYVCYFRTWSKGGWDGYRWVSRSTSPDLKVWTTPVVMDKGDAPWEHIYTNQTVPYYRAPHIYIALAARFMPGRRAVSVAEAAQFGVEAKYSGDCSDNVLMTSRGGNRYDRTFLEGFIKPGVGLADWTSRTNYPVRGIVATSDEEMSFYVQHHYGQPSNYLRRYVLRPDGFVSINAPYSGGECVTKPFTFEGDTLVLNFATSAAGFVRVELQEADGKPIKGYTEKDADELLGNRIAYPVSWNGKSDVSALAGKPIRLRFVLKDADVFSMHF